MASRKIFISRLHVSPGFSLMEVLLVLAMLSVIASTTLLFSFSSYQSTLLQAEHETVVTQLQIARAQAQQTKYGLPHGLAFNPAGYAGYVLFSGNSFAVSDTISHVRIPSRAGIATATSTPVEIVFAQLSGSSNFAGEITLHDSIRSSASTTITINYEGAIY